MDKIHELLNFWFGNLGSADLPNSDRTNLWFGENDVGKQNLVQAFKKQYEEAVSGELNGDES